MIPAPRVICLGGAHFDFKLKAFEKLSLNDSNPVRKTVTPGGVARNIAENLARLGVPVSVMSRIGNDLSGDEILKRLSDLSIDVSGITRSTRFSTASYTAFLASDGEMVLAGADMEIYEEITPALLESYLSGSQPGQWIVFDTNLSPETIQFLAHHLPQSTQLFGIPVSGQKVGRLREVLPQLGGLILNLDELRILCETSISSPSEIQANCLELVKRGLSWVIVTSGGEGISIAERTDFYHVPVQKRFKSIDVTGAGDSFAAGVFYGLHQGHGLLDSIRWGMGCAHLTLQTTSSVNPDLNPTRLTKMLETQSC
jgi:pseudouridine kinase